MKIEAGDIIKLTKISDNKFDGNHPNGIIEGTERIGVLAIPIEVGESVMITGIFDYFITSTVTEIIDDHTIKTKNSTYFIQKQNEDDKI